MAGANPAAGPARRRWTPILATRESIPRRLAPEPGPVRPHSGRARRIELIFCISHIPQSGLWGKTPPRRSPFVPLSRNSRPHRHHVRRAPQGNDGGRVWLHFEGGRPACVCRRAAAAACADRLPSPGPRAPVVIAERMSGAQMYELVRRGCGRAARTAASPGRGPRGSGKPAIFVAGGLPGRAPLTRAPAPRSASASPSLSARSSSWRATPPRSSATRIHVCASRWQPSVGDAPPPRR